MPLKIIIVGAGIGGPAVAIALARSGHRVTIYERSKSTSDPVGYAFRITPNSDRCLKHLGIDTVAGGAVPANTSRQLDAEGNVVREVRENKDAEMAKRAVSVFAYRPQLHRQLMQGAHEAGVRVMSGVKVTAVDVETTAIVLEDGARISADLIIGADGVYSVVRPHLVDTSRFFPHASTGHNAFRFMVDKFVVQNDSIMAPVVNDDFRMFTWAGNGKRILVYPVDYDKQFNVTCTYPEELSDNKETLDNDDDDAAAIAYNQKASFSTVQSIYSDFDPVARRLLELPDPDGFRIWKLVDMDDIPNWSSNHTALLGDACHPVSPFGFSGASMAIEDALTLSTLLPVDIHAEEVEERLRIYQEIRKPRVDRVREQARKHARGEDDGRGMKAYMEFLGEHDAVEFARLALEKHLESHPRS